MSYGINSIDKELFKMDVFNEGDLYKLVNELSLQYFDKPFKHYVTFNNRLRTTGGRYIPAKKRIELNPKYVIELEKSEFIGIIKHELCHYHLHIEGKGYKHGDKAFKELLMKTNSPRYCKPLPSMVHNNKHIYKCTTCHYIYKRVRRINLKKYRCGRCHGHLKKEK